MKTTTRILSTGACAALLALLSATAGAQVATSLINEGDPLPAAGAGHTVFSINNTAVNGVGGYAATINSSGGGTTLSHVWGNAAGGAGAIIRTEAVLGIYDQTSFESFFGMDDTGRIAYGPTCTDTGTLVTGLDCVWVDATAHAVEGLPIPSLPGKEWRFASRPGITNSGTPYWVSGINDTGSGANEGNGLFTSAGVQIKTGDVIAGLPAPLGSSAADFDVRFSAGGSHYIVGTDTTAATSADFYVLLDGAPIPSGASILGEGQPVPAAAGGLPGESWANFDFMGVNEAGDYMVTGDTGGPIATDEFISFNGNIVYREGDVVDGETLTGSIEGAYMNEAGDIAYIWDIDDPGGDPEALYLNNDLLLKEGDAVDLFGQDGIVEPTSILVNFTGISAVTMGPNRLVYFTADIDVNGTSTSSDDIEGFFCIDPGPWANLENGLAGTGGLQPTLDGSGTLAPATPIALTLDDAMPSSSAWLFIGVFRIDQPFKGGVLVPKPNFTLAALPVGPLGDLVLGSTWPGIPSGFSIYFQYWVVDAGAPFGASASNALSATQP